MRKATKKNERENLQVPPLTTATKKWESIDCDRLKVRDNTHTHAQNTKHVYRVVRLFKRWEHMEFNFSKRKPISGTLCITIENLIRLSSAMAINTFIAFILFDWGFFIIILRKNPKTFPFCIGNGRLFVGYWCCLVRLIISTSFACIIQTREKKTTVFEHQARATTTRKKMPFNWTMCYGVEVSAQTRIIIAFHSSWVAFHLPILRYFFNASQTCCSSIYWQYQDTKGKEWNELFF